MTNAILAINSVEMHALWEWYKNVRNSITGNNQKTKVSQVPQWLKKQQQETACQRRRYRRCVFDFLGWKDTLEKEKATHSSIFAWIKSHGQRSLVGYTPWGCKELGMTEHTTLRKPASSQISRNNKVINTM